MLLRSLFRTCLLPALLATGFVFAVHAGDMSGQAAIVIDHNCIDNKDNLIPQEWLDKARRKGVYFGHQSVGSNMLDGLDELSNTSPKRYKIEIVENPAPEWFDKHGGIGHNPIGENGNPASKVRDFIEQMTGKGYGRHAGTGMMKFCFVDITAATNVTGVFNTYRQGLEGLEHSCPKTVLVWWTVPVVKDGNNKKRESYNALVRDYCRAHNKVLFDIADIESYSPGGQRRLAYSLPVLDSSYTEDGSHPDSHAGKLRLARAYWWLAARLSGWKG